MIIDKLSEFLESHVGRILAVLLVGFTAGGTGAISMEALNPSRPDPFTGQMGVALEQRLNKRIDSVRDELKRDQENDVASIYRTIERIDDKADDISAKIAELNGLLRGMFDKHFEP